MKRGITNHGASNNESRNDKAGGAQDNRRGLKLAHASDIHLDTDYHGGTANLAGRDYCRKVFANLLRAMRAHQPDLFLLPGDLFDSNHPSPDTVYWAMERLGELPFPVAMIPGNHDCLEPDGVFLNHDFNAIPNVEMLTEAEGEIRELPKLGVRLWGKGMVEHSPDYRPLQGMPTPDKASWNLAMGHGIYVGNSGMSYRSSPVEAAQIAKSGYDYIALGHHHALLDASQENPAALGDSSSGTAAGGAAVPCTAAWGTAAWYSGAPIPISPDGAGTWLGIDLEAGNPARVVVHQLD